MQGMLRIHTYTEDPPRERDEPVAALVARSKRGDVEAFTQIYRDYVARVYDYAARRLNSRHAAEEATQEVFYRAFRGIAGCRDDEAFAGWLFAIARFVIADVYRGKSRDTAPLDAAIEAEDPDPLPEEQMLRAERRAQLQAARQHCLTERDRELLDLLLADLTDREIAVALDRRYGAIRTAHWRLVTRLRDCFATMADEKGVRHVAT